jgi:hypothetical protein
VLYRDVLGLASVDSVKKKVAVRFNRLQLKECEGTIPTVHGKVTLHWRQSGNRLFYKVGAPKGYTIEIENDSGRRLATMKQ